MTNASVYAIRKLQNAAAWLSVTQERTAAISKAEYIISDAIKTIWDTMPIAERSEYYRNDQPWNLITAF